MNVTVEQYRRRAEKLRNRAVTEIRPELFEAAKEYDDLAFKLERVLEARQSNDLRD